ncbi:MerR family transcriptional regulator [Pseudomonas sp. dw_358]|uniref:MerR family transcriptional regulator n=1 Tax=Pseudomonas sp. dw_358 TaxID=2720083 RepID=UPI002116A53E|nr:MerR family transcriptional regulator [Pseudomonas sp. dw_358]
MTSSLAAPDLSSGWLPIREVSRLTGVNPVTLRAWERRYGLVVPHRTAKGHRLFDIGHVARIQEILTWLNRGVAVSQVKALLDAPAAEAAVNAGGDWLPLRQSLILAIGSLAERRLDELFNQAMSLYPPATLCEQLMLPLLAELDNRWQGQFGAQMERVFFLSWLRSKLGARLYHNNRQQRGKPLLLVNQSDVPMEPMLWMTAWLASSADCPVEVFDWPLPPGELALAVERLGARAVVLYAGKSLNMAQLPRLLSKCHCAKLLVGPAVRIHRSEWPAITARIDDLSLADTPLAAHSRLHFLGLLQPQP